ncbi:MAG: hypothetical protein Q9174_003008 [Haloplaca sp. 1 TL-2023]
MTKRKRQQGYYTKRMKAVQEGSNEEVLLADIRALLSTAKKGLVSNASEPNVGLPTPVGSNILNEVPPRFSEVEVEISALSSTGDGLGLSYLPDHVFVVPFTIPGDIVKAKVVTHFTNEHYTLTDFVSVLKSSPRRNDSLIQCRYFAQCSGCQLQMLSYEEQLVHKKTVLQKAYLNFSNLAPELLPIIGDTIGSPMQYGYRTKLTPHFDGPPGSMSRKVRRDPSQQRAFEEVPPIGFMKKGTRKTIDIEECPIGTEVVQEGLKKERKRVAEELSKYRRGATLLLRETTTRVPVRQSTPGPDNESTTSENTEHVPQRLEPTAAQADLAADSAKYVYTKTYITDQNALSREHIGPYIFVNAAGSFFQNNNSILPSFTSYLRSHILRAPSSSSPDSAETSNIKYLVDAYSGSGLFSITLSSLFTATLGIDIAPSSIASAKQNASLNSITNATFVAGDAANIFAEAKERFLANESVVVIDPPRKGCDDHFLKQLLGWAPKRVVYVSCNVHTQARDVGVLVRGGKEGWEQQGKVRYRIESLRGFDFFPQTGHVEGVAVLQRVEPEDEASRVGSTQ